MKYLGDYKEDATLDFMWNSFDALGASITRSTNGTISVYKGNSTTQSTAGVTDTEDFDSLTGLHHCRIDLSSNVFYATANDYMVVLSAATIDGQTINAVIAHFSIENRFTNVTKVNGTSQTAGDLADLITTVDTVVDGIQTDLSNGTDGLGAIKAVADAIETDTQDLQTQIGTAGAGLTDLGGMSTAMKAEVNAEADTALSDYDPPTRAELTSDKNEIITDLDDIKGTGFVKDTHSLVDIEAYVDILDDGTSGNAKIASDVADVLTDTNELQTDDVPGLIGALNDLSAAAVNAEVVDALSTDTYAEPSGVPGATVALATKIGYLYMALRNQIDITASKKTFYDDGGSAEWEKDLTDNGTTYSESEGNAI